MGPNRRRRRRGARRARVDGGAIPWWVLAAILALVAVLVLARTLL